MDGSDLMLYDNNKVLLLRAERSPNSLYKTTLTTGRPTFLLAMKDELA